MRVPVRRAERGRDDRPPGKSYRPGRARPRRPRRFCGFFILRPRAPAAAAASVAGEAMRATRVLIIDDETHIRSIVRAAVESDGGTAYEAATGATGLELARTERPEL